MANHYGLGHIECVKYANDIFCDTGDGYGVPGKRRTGGTVGVDGDAAVVRVQMRDDGEIVVLRRAESVYKDECKGGGCWGTGWVGVCVVKVMATCLYEGHGGNKN